MVPLDMAEVSPGRGAPPRSPPPGGGTQPLRRRGEERQCEARGGCGYSGGLKLAGVPSGTPETEVSGMWLCGNR